MFGHESRGKGLIYLGQGTGTRAFAAVHAMINPVFFDELLQRVILIQIKTSKNRKKVS